MKLYKFILLSLIFQKIIFNRIFIILFFFYTFLKKIKININWSEINISIEILLKKVLGPELILLKNNKSQK